MKRLAAIALLSFAMFIGNAGVGNAPPACEGSPLVFKSALNATQRSLKKARCDSQIDPYPWLRLWMDRSGCCLSSKNMSLGDMRCLMEYWNECVGDFTSVIGERYIGEFRGSEYHGKGRLIHPDGRVEEGIWEWRLSKTSKANALTPETADPLEALEKKCSALGFIKGTEKHGDCVMKLFR